MKYDKIIIGAGIYGLYAALFCAKKKEKILVLEKEDAAFKRATYINQARVHMGYHYPRSYSTAIKSAGYFERFNKDYDFSILSDFDQVYATSKDFSWTNAEEFKKFCENANIVCDEVSASKYFKDDMCNGEKGLYIWANGERYNGTFRNNKMDTRSVDSDGNFIRNEKGEFVHGDMAVYTFTTGRTYTGYFMEGQAVGINKVLED